MSQKTCLWYRFLCTFSISGSVFGSTDHSEEQINSTCNKILFFLLAFSNLSIALFAAGIKEDTDNYLKSEMSVIEESESTVTFRESDGKIVTLPKNPERTIVCQNSILDLWYMSGGTSLARVRGEINIPPEAEGLPQLGSIGTLNTELIMEIQPDFLIFTVSSAQAAVRKFFTNEGVPSVTISYNTYDDFIVILDLFTRLNNTRNIYSTNVTNTDAQVQHIINQVPRTIEPPKICILFASTKYVKVETQNTITGWICNKLGAENIYVDNTGTHATRVALSTEYIMEKDPDIIFITTMGDVEKCKDRVDKDIMNNGIWETLSAVKNERFIYLDKSYSFYKPNRFYPEAFKIIAEYIYPDTVFTELNVE